MLKLEEDAKNYLRGHAVVTFHSDNLKKTLLLSVHESRVSHQCKRLF